jgi:hypothetical protein
MIGDNNNRHPEEAGVHRSADQNVQNAARVDAFVG